MQIMQTMQTGASTWFGNYEVLRRLRVGGMATLYLARRHGADGSSRVVALKLIHPRLTAQPGYVEMFVDEARICSQISHPNVIRVEEFGVIDGVHYLAMEYLDGCSVAELLQRSWHAHRPLDPDLAARILMQVAGGLHAAHETRGRHGEPLDIIHRDISPSNILLSLDGNATLIDFGLARARNRLFETQGATIKGKFNYMAPEQATRGTVDRRCDVFSLGVVFWELLVGWPLFPDDSIVGLSNRLHRTHVVAPSVANPWVTPAFDLIVLDMLRHDPAERLRTAAEVRRRIAIAAPGAGPHEASALGALVREVRERRLARRAREGTEASSSHPSFSSVLRAARASPLHPCVEIEPAPAPAPRGPEAGQAAPRRRRWPRVLVVAAGLSVLGVAASLRIGRGERLEVRAPATPSHRNEIELVEVSPVAAASGSAAAAPGPAPVAGSAAAAPGPAPVTPADVAASPSPAASLPGRAVTSARGTSARFPAPPASPAGRGAGRPPARAPKVQGSARTTAPPAPRPSGEASRLTPGAFDDPYDARSTAPEPDRNPEADR